MKVMAILIGLAAWTAAGASTQDVAAAAAPQPAATTQAVAAASAAKPGKTGLWGRAVGAKDAGPARESVITAAKIEFDNKEGVILFDENVLVDDAQFIMRADRLLVFMEGTNDVQQLLAVGRVSITNENRAASCDKAVYTKKDGQIVMSGAARLMQQGSDAGEVTGDRIVIWLDDQRMEVTGSAAPPRVVLPPGTLNKGDHKLLP